MATKPEDTTSVETVGAAEIRQLLLEHGTLIGINQARQIVKALTEELVQKKFFVLPHRIPKEYFLIRYGFKGVNV